MRMPTATRTRTQPINIETLKGGPLVPYRPPAQPSPSPQVLTPQPRGTYSNPAPKATPKSAEPDIIDAEIVRTSPRTAPGISSRRPVVGNDAKPSSESARPEYYPRYPNPADGWRSTADFIAWQNGRSRESLDAEREAYEFTKDWGKSGGLLYPFTENGPRTPIISENFTLANRFRARHGLPAIDRYGNEQPQPINPSVQPGRGFQSNPFKRPAEPLEDAPGTPSNFPAEPYNFDIDPETGQPYTELQRRRGGELGRPAWHIDPTTGNPWGDDEPGTPFPNPFPGYPGAAVTYPDDDRKLKVVSVTYTFEAGSGPGIPETYVPWRASVTLAPGGSISQSAGGPGETIAYIGGVAVAVWGDPTTVGMTPTFRIVNTVPNIGVDDPSGAPDVQLEPLGNPGAKPRPRERTAPRPVQDPRVDPTLVPTLPGMPTRTLPENPNTLPQLPKPATRPVFEPLPSIPGTPEYAPRPQPYPRSSPVGQPQPSNDPQGQPSPARPATPRPTSTTDRGKNPPVNPGPNSDKCDPCPDPCREEELVEIRYKNFIGCNVTPQGVPDRFREVVLKVPEKSAPAIKSMLDSLAEIRALECEPCCYWDVVSGTPVQVFSGFPPIEGLNVLLPQGCNGIVIEYDIADAIADQTLRNAKRFIDNNTEGNTFVNTAIVYIVNASGHAIAAQEIWVPRWEFTIPMQYREQRCSVRLMPKSLGVKFKVFDSGSRWVQITG